MLDPKPRTSPSEPLLLGAFLPYRLSILGERISRAFAKRYGAMFGLGIPEWRVMAVLGEPGPWQTRQVIGRTEMDRVKVSRAVTRLVDTGLVSQTAQTTDQRAHLLELTEHGLAVYRQIVPIARALEAEFVAVLDPAERQALEVILTKLHASAGRLWQQGEQTPTYRPRAAPDG